MVEFFSILIGIFGTLLFTLILGVMIFLFVFAYNQKFNRIIRINNKTAGKDSVEWYKGRIKKHKTLGEVYEIPALKKEDRHYAPYYGKEFEFPTNKGKKMYVPLTFFNGTYAPERYSHKEDKELEVIEKRYGTLTEKEYLDLSVEERLKNKNNYKVTFHKTIQKVSSYIVKPTKYSMRQFNLELDTAIKDDFLLNPSWFEKYGGYVIAASFAFFGAIVAIIMIIFAYQWGVDIAQTTPAWIENFVGAVSQSGTLAPPPTGGVAP